MPPFPPRRTLLSLGAAVALAWAGSPAARGGTIRHDRDPTVHTTIAADPAYQSVGLLEVDVFEEGQPAVGSATLVAPDWVMTAAHVIEGGRSVRFSVAGQTYAASRWLANPRYDGSLIKGYDIALIQLAQPVVGVTPAQMYRGKRELGLEATFVGYGRTGTGLTGDEVDDRTKRAGTNAIDGQLRRDRRGLLEVIPKLRSNYRTFAVDFDAPGNPSENRIGSPEPTDLEYLISRGDSGGAAFVDDPTDSFGPQVAGVHSFGEIFDERDDSDYGDMTGHTRVRSFARWVDKVILSERYQRKLRFISPTQATQELGLDPSARSIGASPSATGGVPEPAAAAVAGVAAIGLLGRRSRRRGR